MSFAGLPGALAKPFRLLPSLPRELRGIAAAGGFLFFHPKREAGESPRDVENTRAAGSAGGRLSSSSLHLPACLRVGVGLGRGIRRARGSHWVAPGLVLAGSAAGAANRGGFAGSALKGGLRTWTHPHGKEGEPKPGGLRGARSRGLNLLSR